MLSVLGLRGRLVLLVGCGASVVVWWSGAGVGLTADLLVGCGASVGLQGKLVLSVLVECGATVGLWGRLVGLVVRGSSVGL